MGGLIVARVGMETPAASLDLQMFTLVDKKRN